MNRRNFLQITLAAPVAALIPSLPALALPQKNKKPTAAKLTPNDDKWWNIEVIADEILRMDCFKPYGLVRGLTVEGMYFDLAIPARAIGIKVSSERLFTFQGIGDNRCVTFPTLAKLNRHYDDGYFAKKYGWQVLTFASDTFDRPRTNVRNTLQSVFEEASLSLSFRYCGFAGRFLPINYF
jgi:hypothetical protein